VVLLVMSGITLLAHEETYKGTVISAVAAKIQVKVIDEKTKKESTMDFVITAKTKVLRGEKLMSLAEAKIQKDERIAVTVNHDVSMTDATVVRLAAKD
jgi:outer membrane translocation and assembly module TamA